MSVSICISAPKAKATAALQVEANHVLALALHHGLTESLWDKVTDAVVAARKLIGRSPKGADVQVSINLQPDPLDPMGFSVSLVVTARRASSLVASAR